MIFNLLVLSKYDKIIKMKFVSLYVNWVVVLQCLKIIYFKSIFFHQVYVEKYKSQNQQFKSKGRGLAPCKSGKSPKVLSTGSQNQLFNTLLKRKIYHGWWEEGLKIDRVMFSPLLSRKIHNGDDANMQIRN